MSIGTTTELVAEFARCVANQNEAIARGDATSGNRFAKRYLAAFEKLRGRCDAGRDALSTLLTDGRPMTPSTQGDLDLMSLRLCLMVSLLALSASSIAQEEARPPEGFVMPLRADDLINDPLKGVTIIRGSIDWPDHRTTTDVLVTCARNWLTIEKGHPPNILAMEVEPSFCNVLARGVQRRN